MANNNDFSTVKGRATIISKMATGLLRDNLQFIKSVDKEPESSFGNYNGYKSGDTININNYSVFPTQSDSLDITSTDSEARETVTALALNKTETIPVLASSLDFSTNISREDFIVNSARVIEPAMVSLASKVESRVLALAADATYNTVGTAGSTVFNTATTLLAKDALSQELAPMGDRKILLNSTSMSSAINARTAYFNPNSEISKQYKTGYMGTADGFDWMENELLPTHTNGNDVSFEVSTTVSVEGSTSLVVEGLTTTTGTVTKGTTFTIATVNAVHPQTKEDTGRLQKFVVTADATANGSGVATLSISPAIYTSASAGLQNVTAFPADGDACTVLTGAASTGYIQNLAYHPSAFRFISAKMYQPKSAEMVGVSTQDGITVNMVSDYDNNTRSETIRFDVLFGFAAVRPQWSVRLTA